MIRCLPALLLTLSIAVLGTAPAQEKAAEPAPMKDEPIRLKKKEKKPAPPGKSEPMPDKPAPKKVEEKPSPPMPMKKAVDEPREEPAAAPPEEEEDVVLERVARNLRAAEEKLAKAELGEATRQVQDDILRDLDALLNRGGEPPPSQGQQSGESQPQDGSADNAQQQKSKTGQPESQPQPGPSGSEKSKAGQQKRKRRLPRSQASMPRPTGNRRGEMARVPQPMSKSKGDEKEPMSDPKAGNGEANEPGAGARGQSNSPNRAAEIYKDVWGHLPESLRAEMNAYFQDRQFMAKYDELIKRYYRSIAEKGQPPRR